MAGKFSILAVFKGRDKISAPVSRMQNRIKTFTRAANNSFKRLNKTVGKFTNGLKTAGRKAVVIGGIAALAFGAIMRPAMAFEQAITNVGAVSLKTRAQISDLEKEALRLGRTTKFTATESANAMEVMARAGFKSAEILSAIPSVLNAAAASGLDIAEVANHVSNTLKGMNMPVTDAITGMSNAARIADVLALASSKTNSTIGSLGESISNVSSTARKFKIPLEDVVAGVALLQDVGLPATVAGSAFNVMLTKMAAPTDSLTKKMDKMSVKFKDAKGNMLPLTDVLGQLDKAAKKSGGNMDQVAFLAELVGLRGQKAASNLADLFASGKFEGLTNALKNAEGSAAKMAALRMDTTQGSIERLKSAVEGVSISIGKMNTGKLKEMIDGVTQWVNANQELITAKVGAFMSKMIDGVKWLVKYRKPILAIIATIGTLIVILKVLTGVLLLINLIVSANPIVLIVLAIIAAVVALVAVVVFLVKHWDMIVASVKRVGSAIANAFDGLPLWGKIIAAIVTGPIGLLMAAILTIKKHWDKIVAGFEKVKRIGGIVGGWFGGGGGDNRNIDTNNDTNITPQVITPSERVAKTINENNNTNSSEVTIRTGQGVEAEVTKGTLGNGLMLASSGAF